MSARRAARAPRSAEPEIDVPDGELPACIRIGACVEVWGPDEAESERHRFAKASAIYWRVRHAIAPSLPDTRFLSDAWSTDRRRRPNLRLYPVQVDESFDPVARLAEAGCGLGDIPRLRAEALELYDRLPSRVPQPWEDHA